MEMTTLALLVAGVLASPATASPPWATAGLSAPEVRLGEWQTVWLDPAKFPGARCLDGSQGAFYLYLSPARLDKWLIYLEGGGWCQNLEDCYQRSLGRLGSSRNVTSMSNPGEVQLMDDCERNPEFCTYNKVRLHYCDGNSFIGDNPDAVEVPLGGPGRAEIYFRGAQILAGVVETVWQVPLPSGEGSAGTPAAVGLSRATDVLLTGCSAGGLATFLNADRLGDSYFNPLKIPTLRRYKAMPISGFFLNQRTVLGEEYYGGAAGYMREIHRLSRGRVPDRCAAALAGGPHDEYLCNFAENALATTRTPVFFLNSAIDSWQMGNIFTNDDQKKYGSLFACRRDVDVCNGTQLGEVRAYEDTFMATLKDPKRNISYEAYLGGNSRQHGAFIHSCQTHCEAQDPWVWHNLTTRDDSARGAEGSAVRMVDALLQWWNDMPSSRADGSHYHQEPCEIGAPPGSGANQCNKKCAHHAAGTDFFEKGLARLAEMSRSGGRSEPAGQRDETVYV